jgi:hypothetical protein
VAAGILVPIAKARSKGIKTPLHSQTRWVAARRIALLSEMLGADIEII